MGEGTRYCATCERVTPPTPGRTRVCYICDSLYAPTIALGRPPTTERKGKGNRSVIALGVKNEARRAPRQQKSAAKKKAAR
jgi:hypothetical protein